MEYCIKCGFPDTRPGIHFEDGICQGCLYEVEKDKIDWEQRWKQLEYFIEAHPSKGMYDCVIAVSGGKDSYYITHLFTEKLGLNCLLVNVDDGFTKTNAGKYNLKNLQEVFNCDLLTYKMKPEIQREMMRYTFEKYGRPCYIIHRLIYTVPIHLAIALQIPIVVYGENVAVTRGLEDNEDTPIAWNQLTNTVASGIPLKTIATECDIDIKELKMAQFPIKTEITTPIYTSYFVRWDAWNNYKFAESRGFKTLEGEWNRNNGWLNFWAIDSYGYLIDSALKYTKLKHSYIMDCTCELIRSGKITKEKGFEMIEKWDGLIDPLMLEDFCKALGYTESEFYGIYLKFVEGINHDE